MPHRETSSSYKSDSIIDNFRSSLDMVVPAPVGAMSISPAARESVHLSDRAHHGPPFRYSSTKAHARPSPSQRRPCVKKGTVHHRPQQPVQTASVSTPRRTALGRRVSLRPPPPALVRRALTVSLADVSFSSVQWAPHACRPRSIVSTSAQKLLLWDLGLSSQKGIAREVEAHTRAIADINWAVFNPDIVATAGIDGWIKCWDLRTSMEKDAGRFSAWGWGCESLGHPRRVSRASV